MGTVETAESIMVRFLAISGSLRAASSNTALLQAAASVARPNVVFSLYKTLGDLPPFNPDLDTDIPPRAVADWRAQILAANAVLICSPEYAHGVPGVLKNALDWIVGSGELVDKPVALFNTRPRSTFAQASLRETLTVMMARIQEDASLSLALPGNTVTASDILADSSYRQSLRDALDALTQAVLSPPVHRVSA